MKSIKTKLLLSLLTSLLLPMSIVGFLSGKNILDGSKPLYLNSVYKELSLIDDYFELFFSDVQDTVDYLANKPVLYRAGNRLTVYKNNNTITTMNVENSSESELEIYEELKTFIDAHPAYRGAEFGTPYGGYIRYPLSNRKPNYNPLERGWYKAAMESPGKAVITTAAPSSDGQTIEISIVKTVSNSKNIVGVISVKITLESLTEIIKSKKVGDDGYIVLIAGESTILSDPLHKENIFKKLNDVDYYKSIIESNFLNDQVYIDKQKMTVVQRDSNSLNFKYLGFVHNEEITKLFRDFLKPLIITAAILTVIFSLLALLLSNSIATPIKVIAGILKSISQGQGDLTKELQVLSKDELGKMAESFNDFTGTMNSMILSIKQSTIELTQMGEDLANDMDETSTAITQITANIESTKTQINTQENRVSSTSSAVEEITQNINSLNRMVDDQIKAVEDSNGSINTMVNNIGVVNGNIDVMDNLFTELLSSSESGKIKIKNVYERAIDISAQSEDLQETNKVIAGIASKTNLLAMNAAIEAAHAGDSGKGFAVVADEIRKLAETSSKQSKDISNQLKDITKVITTVVDASKAAEDGFSSVVKLINDVNKLEGEIKSSMNRQIDESSHVSESLERITNLTTGVKQGSEEMKVGNDQILEDISILSDISKQILHSIEEISQGNSDINSSVIKVTEMSRNNRDTIKKVFDSISKFKLKEE